MKVLVTGGAGFIGSHACKALAAAGHEVVVYDNLSTGHAHAVRWGPLEIGDIRNTDSIQRSLERHQPDMVMHFAALAYVGESMAEPAAYYDVNLNGTASLLSAMLSAGVEKIVFSSTCATYGIPEELPIKEATPQQPVNPYGFTKLCVERMLKDYERAYGLRWAALRYFNAAGADPEGELGEDHFPETHALPLAIRAALGTGTPFQIFGQDFPTADGSAVRDYIHVTDLADAHVRSAEFLGNGGQSIALNLGTGKGTSVLELIDAVSNVVGRDVPVIRAPRRAGDPPSLYADASLARKVLGWQPQHSSIAELVGTAAAWLDRGAAAQAA